MNVGLGGYAQRPKGIPTWVVVLIVCGGVGLIGFVSLIGYAVINVTREAVLYERVNDVLDEDYRRYHDGRNISQQQPFEGSDAVSVVGNHLHEMVRLLQIEFNVFMEKYDTVDWHIDTQFKSLNSESAYQRALKEIDKSVEPYDHFAIAKERILEEYIGLIRQAARGDKSAQEIADYYIEYERADLESGKAYRDGMRDLATARKKRLEFIWSNRNWFALGAEGKWVLVSTTPSAIKSKLDQIESKVADVLDRLDEIYDSWGD